MSPAEKANAQRQRIEARAKVLRSPLGARVCVVVLGTGTNRRLAEMLAPLVGHVTVMAEPGETPGHVVDRVIAQTGIGTIGPKIVVIGPAALSGPVAEVIRMVRPHWPAPVDLLAGLRSVDRQAFLRAAIRKARGEATPVPYKGPPRMSPVRGKR